MTGKLIINGVDVYTEFGAFVVENGHADLVKYSSLKDIETNNWHEYDGIEVDLSNPKLASKQLVLKMAFSGDKTKFANFIKHITVSGYRDWNFANILRTYRLRLVSNGQLQVAGELRIAELTLVDDFPLNGYSYQTPTGSYNGITENYEIDGKQLSQYGVSVLQGALAEIEKVPSVKINLLRTANNISGSIYDSTTVVFNEKTVQLNCLMRADNLADLWRNYDALLFDLIRPDVRDFYSPTRNEYFQCFYKQSDVSKFYPTNKPWLEFTLDLVFIFAVIDGEDMLLSSEDDYLIVTEDGKSFIDMKPNA